MHRREFLVSMGVGSAALAAGRIPHALAQTPAPEPWRSFEIVTHVHVQHASGVTRVWLPTPLAVAPYQQTLGDTYNIEGGTATMHEREEIDLLVAEWPGGVEPVLTLTSRASTGAHRVDLTTPAVEPPRDLSAFTRYLRATRSMPLDAAIKASAASVTGGAGTDFDKARAIFAAVADGKIRDEQTPDPNILFVRLARASGVPSRAVFGLRLAAGDATKAQHCRAEVYLVGFGWVPVDAQDRTFGSWTMQWIAFNSAHDVTLPGSKRGVVAAVMHPQAETGNGRVDFMNAEAFRYDIAVQEMTPVLRFPG